jgi:hypothetical protein
MSKVFGIVLIVVCLWIGGEIFTEGAENAFDGALVSMGLVKKTQDVEATRPLTKRSGDKVRAAQAEAEARRERLLSE